MNKRALAYKTVSPLRHPPEPSVKGVRFTLLATGSLHVFEKNFCARGAQEASETGFSTLGVRPSSGRRQSHGARDRNSKATARALESTLAVPQVALKHWP